MEKRRFFVPYRSKKDAAWAVGQSLACHSGCQFVKCYQEKLGWSVLEQTSLAGYHDPLESRGTRHAFLYHLVPDLCNLGSRSAVVGALEEIHTIDPETA